MELSVNKIDNANAVITATIKADKVEANVTKIAKQLSKTANVQGFRKGKVPVAIIKKMYGEKLVQDAEGEAFRDLLDEALKELGVDKAEIIGEPSITKYDKKDNGDIDVEVKIAIRPQIELGDYKSLVDEFEKPTVSDEEVEEKLKEIAQENAELVELPKNRIAKEGHVVNIDFDCLFDGDAFEC
jgi:trigger factor